MALVDYSQFGQAFILEQLITDDMPRIVIDIGAHDGISGSNSRRLLEEGWRGVLVEPIPSVFSRLQTNSAGFPNISLVEAACSDRAGTALIHLGSDGPNYQRSSLSRDPEIIGNLTDEAIRVRTTTLAELVSDHAIPRDFGVLLIDTEGWDLTILRGLAQIEARPRIIVTEEFSATNEEKYRFLSQLNYQIAGAWGFDSFWISQSHPANTSSLGFPIQPLPEDWLLDRQASGAGRVELDDHRLPQLGVIGWGWTEIDKEPESNIAVALHCVDSPKRYLFQAWRMPRPDVASYFGSEKLLMSGYRAYLDVPPGIYDLRVIQEGCGIYTNDFAARVRIDTRAERLKPEDGLSYLEPAAIA